MRVGMEELRIKAGGLELSASGESGTIKEASKDCDSTMACRVNVHGGYAYDWIASGARRVPFCFCIKKS